MQEISVVRKTCLRIKLGFLTYRATFNESDDELSQLADKDQYSDRNDSPLQKAKWHRTSNAKTQAPRKKHVRGRQGGLQGIMKMPLEIFTEVRHLSCSETIYD